MLFALRQALCNAREQQTLRLNEVRRTLVDAIRGTYERVRRICLTRVATIVRTKRQLSLAWRLDNPSNVIRPAITCCSSIHERNT